MQRFGVDPKRATMFEDTAKNLKPARELGMRTVWLRNERPGAQPDPELDRHIQHVADELSDFLHAILDGRQVSPE